MAIIYALIDPRTPDAVRYVGVTKQDPRVRLAAHISEAMRVKEDGSWALPINHRRAWIRALTREGVRPEMTILTTVEDSVRRDEEHLWIVKLRDAGHPLTNATDGREGPEHYKPTDAAKARNSASQIIRYLNPQEVERNRANALRSWENEAYREKVVAGVTASWVGDEARRQRFSEEMRARRSDPANKYDEALRAFYATDEGRASAKRRAKRGEDNPCSKLTWNEVRAIRERYAAGGVRQKDLAATYGVTQTLVGQIVRGLIWKE